MECYHEYVKWSIGETSHKVQLTLTWNFSPTSSSSRDDTASLSSQLFDKLHKTLSMAQLSGAGGASKAGVVPPDVQRLVETTPKRHRRTRLKQRISNRLGALRSQLSISRTSLDDLDSYSATTAAYRAPQHNHVTSRAVAAHSRPPLLRNNSFHGYVVHNTPKAGSLSYSPTRSTECSLPGGASSEADTCYSADELDNYVSAGEHVLCFPTGIMYATSATSYSASPHRAVMAYRSTPEIGPSLPDDFMDNTCADRKSRQPSRASIPEPEVMEQTILDWSKIVTGRCRKPTDFRRTVVTNTRQSTGYVTNKQPRPQKPEVKPRPRPKPQLSSARSFPLVLETSAQSMTLPTYTTATNGSRPPSPPRPKPRNCRTPAPTRSHISTTFYADSGSSSSAQSNDRDSTSQNSDVGKCLTSCNKILNRYETEIT